MEARHKNALIGVLLAVVLVMAVGYAAFAQQLTISGTSTITSKWDVHMETGTVATNSTMSTDPTGTVTVANGGLSATFNAKLVSPGDTVTFTVPVVNKGTINAKLSNISLSGTGLTVSGMTATSTDGNIKYTVTSPGTATLVGTTGKANVIVKAEFVNKAAGNTNAYNSTASLTVTMSYVQA